MSQKKRKRDQDLTNTEAVVQGRVVEDSFVDLFEIKNRLKQHKFRGVTGVQSRHKQLYVGVPVDMKHCGIIQNEFLLKKINRAGVSLNKNSYGINLSDGSSLVFSSLNGLTVPFEGTQNEFNDLPFHKKSEIVRNCYQFAGLAATRRDVQENSLGFEKGRNDCVTQLGGTRSVYHTGKEFIHAGDRVMWDIPDPKTLHKHYNTPGNEDDKILVSIERYDPEKNPNFSNLVYDLDLEGGFKPGATPKFNKMITMENSPAKSVSEELSMTMAKFILHVLGTAAVFTKVVGAEARLDVTEKFSNINKKQKEARERYKSFINPNSDDDKKNLHNLMIKIFNPTNDHLDKLANTKQEKVHMKNIGKKLLTCFEKCYHDRLDRIIGTALTPSEPGGKFDIKIGKYCI